MIFKYLQTIKSLIFSSIILSLVNIFLVASFLCIFKLEIFSDGN